MQIPNINSVDYDRFDPYKVFNSNNNDMFKQLGLDYVTKKAGMPLYEFLTQDDPIYSINDMATSGLINIGKSMIRKKNRKLMLTLVKFYVKNNTFDIEFGLYTLIILSGVIIGLLIPDWTKLLMNPLRGKVIKSLIINVPKTILNGEDYFDNFGSDLTEEHKKAYIYYFDELNKTITLYISLISYYLHKDANYYMNKYENYGYKWLICNDPYREELYEFVYKTKIPKDVNLYKNKTLAEIYENFNIYVKDMKVVYNEIADDMQEYFEYVEKNIKYFLEIFDIFTKSNN